MLHSATFNTVRFSGTTTLYMLSATHMLVDACCAALVFSLVHIYPISSDTYLKMVIGYNIFAFALQPLCGLITDRLHSARTSALVGILFTGLSLATLLHQPWITIVFAGLGNAFFHIGGGTAALTLRKGHAGPSGLFVAPGAIGLALGALIGSKGVPALWPFTILLIFAAAIIATGTFPSPVNAASISASHSENRNIILLFLLASVALRSFTGFSAGNPGEENRVIIYACITAAACGKAIGGLCADRFGWRTTGTGALLLSVFLLGMKNVHPGFLLTGLLLFQMTMPITLAAVYRLFPRRPGLAFGYCCLALLLGAAPFFTPYRIFFRSTTILVTGILVSLATFYAGLQLLSKKVTKTDPEYKNTTLIEEVV